MGPVEKVLREAAALPKCKFVMARDAEGDPAVFDEASASQFCAAGALSRALGLPAYIPGGQLWFDTKAGEFLIAGACKLRDIPFKQGSPELVYILNDLEDLGEAMYVHAIALAAEAGA